MIKQEFRFRNFSNFKKHAFMSPTSKKKGQTYPSSLLKFSSPTTVNKEPKKAES